MSWPTDLSPTASFDVPGLASDVQRVAGGGEGVPGVVQEGGYRVGTGRGTIPGTQPTARLRLIYDIFKVNRFIRPFDCKLEYNTKI